MQDSLGFLWRECPGGVRLLKVYGDTPCPVVPDAIEGLPVREIGAYCFAEKEVPHGTVTLPEQMDPRSLHPICGNFVQEVILPDSRTIIYNIPTRICCLPGDTVSAYVKVSKVRNFSPDFDYVRHMARRKILYTCLCLDRKRQAECRPCGDVPLSLIPARLRHNFSKKIEIMFRDGSSAGTAAVVKALAYGYQDEIPKTVKESFRNKKDILVVDPSSEFFRYMKHPKGAQ